VSRLAWSREDTRHQAPAGIRHNVESLAETGHRALGRPASSGYGQGDNSSRENGSGAIQNYAAAFAAKRPKQLGSTKPGPLLERAGGRKGDGCHEP
jgi:hypothetical protein